jgi:hypothetical protein
MAKAGELDWGEELNKSDNYKHTPTALWAAEESGGKAGGVDPLNKAEKRNKDGEEPYRPSNEEIAAAVMHGAQSQPTDEQMFGHLVVTEEMAKKSKEDWEGSMNKSLTHPRITKEEDEETEWGSGQSFNSTLTEAERLKRNMHTGE